MAAKLLIIGNNDNAIDMLFDKMNGAFECVTTSHRIYDLKWHFAAFKPQLVIYCMLGEDEKEFGSIASFKREILGASKPLVLIGDENACNRFQSRTGYCADYIVIDQGSIAALKNGITDILENRAQKAPKTPISSGTQGSGSWDDILGQIGDEMAVQKKHVLVIDDDPLMLKVIKDYLHEDYEVATAKGGAIAYKFLEKKHTDLILLDYEMPDEKGPDVFKNIRGIAGMENTPIIFMTGVKDKERIAEIVKVKPQGYIGKPVEREALFAMINKVMGNKA
ncbi:MAG: response regulator [Lachnospiraceae bacterium]|nr:response regulator [Lachnospiraceae bacterium]